MVEKKDPSKKWDRSRLEALLEAFEGKKILVVGDVGVDRYVIGSVERISQEAPVPIVAVQEEKLKLGLAANVADNVVALGGKALLTGVVGRDRASDDLRSLLRSSGIQPSHLVTDASRRTVLKERVVSERQQLLRIDYESVHGISAAVERRLLSGIRALVKKCDAIILQDYAKGLLGKKLAREIFQIARKSGKIVAADPNSRSAVGLYRGATVLTPNTREAEQLSGIAIRDDRTLEAAGRFLLKATAARHIVITRGKDGMAIFKAGRKTVDIIPTYAQEVYDVSGAGDTVISVLALALSSGATIEEAAVLGNLAAGVEVGKRGTATVAPDEIRSAMDFFEAVGV